MRKCVILETTMQAMGIIFEEISIMQLSAPERGKEMYIYHGGRRPRCPNRSGRQYYGCPMPTSRGTSGSQCWAFSLGSG